jgi:hypothetical protein
VTTLTNVKELRGPQFLHVITKKGYGYARAEEEPILYHGVTPFDPAVGIVPKAGGKPAYTNIFGDWICDMAAADPRLVGITPAMREGSGLVRFSQQFPDRYFDVGIAEQHAVTFAAGLACDGMKPVVAIYSTFLQRAYDQLIHDVALQNLPVVFAIDRAGIVGADGATHCGAFDLSYLRCVPNMIVMAPADENECRQMLYTAYLQDAPTAVRYPRGSGPGVDVAKQMTALPIGKGEIRCTASRRTERSHRDPRVWRHGEARARRCRGARCDGREHALRETARRGSRFPLGARARLPRDGRGERRRRRCGQRGRRSARGAGHPDPAAAIGLARHVHRSRRSCAAPRELRARRAGHCGIDQRAVRGAAHRFARKARGVGTPRMASRPVAISASTAPRARRISPTGSMRKRFPGSSCRSTKASTCPTIRARSPGSASWAAR